MLDPRINATPPGFQPERDLPPGFMTFFHPLHEAFTPRQKSLAAKRAASLQKAQEGTLPAHLSPSEATTSAWEIRLPDWVCDQRNQMTGPADDAELVVKMLNSGAPGVMLDLEDAMANTWSHLMLGIDNSIRALHGELTYFDEKRNRTVSIEPSRTVAWVRTRGLHMSQAGLLKDREALVSASLFDLALVAYKVDPARLKHPLCIYIPKSESAEEALLWRDAFQAISRALKWEPHYIKCMALVEAHPMAYEMEEFLYNLRDHAVGLDLGRWDYMASLIHFNLKDPDWVLPDRNTIPHNVPFFQRLRELLVEICHKRGVLAIGGMTALFPSRTDPELNERALKVLAEDKKNEAGCFMDGAWTGHPDQNEIAVAQFPHPNQVKARLTGTPRYPDLRPVPSGVGRKTVEGTRTAVSTVIRYRYGVLTGSGASLINGYMEDLATDRIYRLMIAQRVRHRGSVRFEGAGDQSHTEAWLSRVFDEELKAILEKVPGAAKDEKVYAIARRQSEDMILKGEFDPV